MDMIQNKYGSRRKLRNFLLLHDSLLKRKSSEGYDSKHTSVAEINTSSWATSASNKSSIRKIGVHLRLHKTEEFHNLSKECINKRVDF